MLFIKLNLDNRLISNNIPCYTQLIYRPENFEQNSSKKSLKKNKYTLDFLKKMSYSVLLSKTFPK